MDEQRQDCWSDVTDVMNAGCSRVLLYGPSGTGKTYFGLLGGVSAMSERLVCTEDMTSADVMGTWMPTGHSTWEWHDGPALRAWRANGGVGGRLVIDEVDRASGDALSALLAMTDSLESCRWRHPSTGEWVTPGPGFSVVMTSNIDDVRDIPSALLDRFPVRIRIDRPHPSSLATLSNDLRAPAAAGVCGPVERRVSLRSFYAFDQLRHEIGEERAARVVFADHKDAVLDALRLARLS